MYQHICSSALNLVLGRSISTPGEDNIISRLSKTSRVSSKHEKDISAYHAIFFRVQLQNTAHDGSALQQEELMTAASGDTVTYLEQVSLVYGPRFQKRITKDNNQIVK